MINIVITHLCPASPLGAQDGIKYISNNCPIEQVGYLVNNQFLFNHNDPVLSSKSIEIVFGNVIMLSDFKINTDDGRQ